MEARQRKPGSVRLTDEQYQEMDRLGIDNESAYVKYKLSTAQSKLAVLKPDPQESQVKALPVVPNRTNDLPMVEDKLTIQRLVLENQSLKNKLEEISETNQQTLSGVNQKVHAMLQDELMKRDFEALKKQNTQQEKEIRALEEKLEKSNKETEAKQEEIEALVKKLGLVELGKALLPGAISGLAKQYPNQMKGIAGTLGSLGLGAHGTNINNNEEDKDYLLQILNHLTEVFNEAQFEQVMQLMMQLAEQIQEDDQLLQKVAYYILQLQKKEKQ
ncbi:hypothetical protein U6A24_18365 [Aquimarina gracilis]|uniref:Uncharacterized protein n=1 Tax=Aquimarina gracilis TaxID=874422 RepID=A0ABU6A046_9FLAO|nr:hypothetical protein [Aquimarina gracilis]MEB3347446.1 hypothetical protein [Aquimarina gracilis]